MLFRFVAEEHEEIGVMGWKPLWMQNADPLTGMGAAHDIMEHPRRDDGALWQELQAFGAMLFTRYEGGYWVQKGSINTDWWFHGSGEVLDMISKTYDGEGDDRLCNWLHDKRPLEEHVEEQIHKLLLTVRNDATSEYAHEDDTDKLQYVLDYLSRNRDLMTRHFRAGYRMARRR